MNEHVSKILNHSAFIPVSVGIGSFGIGTAVGYIFGKRKIEETVEFDPQLRFSFDEDEPVEKPHHEPLIIDKEVYEQKAAEVSEVAEFDEVGWFDEQVEEPIDDTPEQTVISHNVFAGSDIEWNMEAELSKRSRNINQPYVIHKDEYFGDEFNNTQMTLTYFAGDNMMIDEHNVPIFNFSEVVGELLFGHGSGQENVFYVRNEKNAAEYEIVREAGHYAVEILGADIEDAEQEKDLKHSNVPRFRSTD